LADAAAQRAATTIARGAAVEAQTLAGFRSAGRTRRALAETTGAAQLERLAGTAVDHVAAAVAVPTARKALIAARLGGAGDEDALVLRVESAVEVRVGVGRVYAFIDRRVLRYVERSIAEDDVVCLEARATSARSDDASRTNN
jgi:hypothetical protein